MSVSKAFREWCKQYLGREQWEELLQSDSPAGVLERTIAAAQDVDERVTSGDWIDYGADVRGMADGETPADPNKFIRTLKTLRISEEQVKNDIERARLYRELVKRVGSDDAHAARKEQLQHGYEAAVAERDRLQREVPLAQQRVWDTWYELHFHCQDKIERDQIRVGSPYLCRDLCP